MYDLVHSFFVFFNRRIKMQGIAKVAISGIRYGVCRQSREERGTVLGVNLAGSRDRVLKKMYSVLGSNLKFGKWQERCSYLGRDERGHPSFTPEVKKALELKDYLVLIFVSEDEAETLWPSVCRSYLYANCISNEEYYTLKTPLLQRPTTQGAKIDPKDVVIAGPKHKDPNNEWFVIDLQDSGSKNKLKQQKSGVKQVNGAATVLGLSSSSSFKNGKDNSVGMSQENPFWNCELKEKENEKPTILLAESVVNEESAIMDQVQILVQHKIEAKVQTKGADSSNNEANSDSNSVQNESTQT
ncbi:hypothetical protein Tco_0250538 [Tanacetum coccineum]